MVADTTAASEGCIPSGGEPACGRSCVQSTLPKPSADEGTRAAGWHEAVTSGETVRQLAAIARIRGTQRYKSRGDAGDELCMHLRDRSVNADIVVFIPNGGAQVGLQVANALSQVRDLVFCPVFKIGSIPDWRFGLGALMDTGDPILNPSVAELLGGDTEVINDCVEGARLRQAGLKKSLHYEPCRLGIIRGQRVLIVDDAIASGYTILAAIRSLRMCGPAMIECASPLASAVGAGVVKAEGVALHTPHVEDVPVFLADAYYADFAAVTAESVLQAIAMYRDAHATR